MQYQTCQGYLTDKLQSLEDVKQMPDYNSSKSHEDMLQNP
jgi:hypothetical protein